MDDDVRARLGDGQLHVRQRLVGDVERVAQPAEGMADHGDVLGAGRQSELEVGSFSLLAFVSVVSVMPSGTAGVWPAPGVVLIIAPVCAPHPVLAWPVRGGYAQRPVLPCRVSE